jgi:hypothetical protein
MYGVAYMLALVLVVYTSNLFTILDDLLDIGFLEDLDSIRLALCEVLELLVSPSQSTMDIDERKRRKNQDWPSPWEHT